MAKPDIPSPTSYGLKEHDGLLVPITTALAAAPDAVIELIKCGCTKTQCDRNSCKCQSNGLNCTEMCACGAEEDKCSNAGHDILELEEEGENLLT